MEFTDSLFSILLLLIFLTIAPTTKSNPTSVNDVLTSHGLPVGIFPKDISDFSIDPASGRFELHLIQSPCDAKFETHVRYDWNVSGTVTFGQITGLSGVAAQELFLWFPVKGIHVDVPSSGLIYFDVGVVSKQFSLSSFETPRDCTIPEGDDELFSLIDLGSRIVETSSEKFKGHDGKAVS